MNNQVLNFVNEQLNKYENMLEQTLAEIEKAVKGSRKYQHLRCQKLFYEQRIQYFNDIKHVLNKQTPQKTYRDNIYGDVWDKCCPNCDEILNCADHTILCYCPFCGQALDWSDENESN